jgi:hypothetical protein
VLAGREDREWRRTLAVVFDGLAADAWSARVPEPLT